MTSARPTFGDFLAAAYRHLSAAVTTQFGSVTPGRDVEDLADGIAHMTLVLSRYTADLTRTSSQIPDKQLVRLGSWDRAAIQAHDALVSATDALKRGSGSGPERDQNVTEPARHLRAAATSLAAGRDLLHGHFSTGSSGARRYESRWSLAITSPPVSRALLGELASLALQTSTVIPAATPPRTAHTRLLDARSRVNSARYWLAQPDAFVYAAERSEPTASDARDVLRAVPANVMPARWAPDNAERVADLLDAVATTAERARQAAWTAARVDPASTAISVTSWHRIAAASTVTSHHCHLLYTTLADRLADHGGELRADILRAADQASRARELWLDSAREFQEITTEVRGHISPAGLEVADLALWTGKLAYANSDWNLASRPSEPVRTGESLVPRLADLPRVIGAIHQTSEALNDLATANLQQARLAVAARRVLVPTRSLPERYNVPTPFAQAPECYCISLIACCQDTSRVAVRATESSAEIAARVGSSSRTLAVTRALAHHAPQARRSIAGTPPSRQIVSEADVGPVESRLRHMGVTNTRELWRAAAIDRATDQVLRDATAGNADRGSVRSGESLRVRSLPQPSSAWSTTAIPSARPDKTSAVVQTQVEAEP